MMRDLLSADLTAMAEGERFGAIRVALQLLVHARWRAVVAFRLAQQCLRFRLARPLGLLLADRVLAFSGAELKPASTIGPGLVLKHTTGLVVGAEVVAGARLTLHQNVTLGDRHPFGGQPTLGDDITIGAGACVLGEQITGEHPADPLVAVEDSRRDRDRTSLLPRRVLRCHSSGQRGGPDGAASPLARRQSLG